MPPAKRARTDVSKEAASAAAAADEKSMEKVRELQAQIAEHLAKDSELSQSVRQTYHQKVLAARQKTLKAVKAVVPHFWRDTITYNSVLRNVVSKEDWDILDTIEDISMQEDEQGLALTLTISFGEKNSYFKDKRLFRAHKSGSIAMMGVGGEHEVSAEVQGPETSGVQWLPGRSTEERNKAAGVEETSADAAYSLFELFDEGPLSEVELPVFFELAKIAEDPVACYTGDDEDTPEELEEEEEDEEEQDEGDADEA